MEPKQFVLEAVMAIATPLAQRGIEITVEKTKEIIEGICQNDPSLRGQIDIDEIANRIQSSTGSVGHVAYNEETLARLLEIPLPDLSTIKPENLDLGVLYNHIKLESEFKEWLEEWGYDTGLGCSLKGLKGVEYSPDVYGQLNTLHGQFEVCVNFVCDTPPSEDRVFALLGKIRAYAEAKHSFSYGDIFAIVTPYRFTQGSINAMTLQNDQDTYSVIQLNGGDVHVLENAQDCKDRLRELQDRARKAEEEARRSEIKEPGGDVQ